MAYYETVELTAKNVYINGVLVTSEIVPIIRCKDCKHWTKKIYFGGKELVIKGRFQGECECLAFPNHTDDYLLTDDDFFCAYGERRTKND